MRYVNDHIRPQANGDNGQNAFDVEVGRFGHWQPLCLFEGLAERWRKLLHLIL
jgi:hypothetical protein